MTQIPQKNNLSWLRVAMLVVTGGVALLVMAGCGDPSLRLANYNSIYQPIDLTKNDNTAGVLLDIKQRAILSQKNKNGDTVICSEPSPDALSAYLADLGASYKDSNGANHSANTHLQEIASFVGTRSETIQLLRDSLYRLCESYMSGAVGQEQYLDLMRRYQTNMVSFLAIEQLTEVISPPNYHQPIILNSGQEYITSTLKISKTPYTLTISSYVIKPTIIFANSPYTVNSDNVEKVADVVDSIVERILEHTYNEASLPSRRKPLLMAIQDDNSQLITTLINGGADVNAKNSDGETPLFAAVWQDKPEIVTLLIKKGADVNAKNIDDETPLLVAVRNINNPEIVSALVSAGARVNINTDGTPTLLHYAVERENKKIVEALVKRGASIEAQDEDGKTPLMLACEIGNKEEIVKALKKELTDC